MKRLLTSLLVFLPMMPVHATGSLYGAAFFGKPFTSATVSAYKGLINASMHYEFVALAIASDNAFGGGQDANLKDAKAEAIRSCKRTSTKPVTCKIVDVNGASALIKKGEVPNIDSSTKYVWCASQQMVVRFMRSTCLTNGGKPFEEKHLAQAEHQRLKKQATSSTSTTTQTAQPTTTQPSVIDKTAEIEFWKSIKDSNDSDMYREYLRQFPSGVYAGLAKLKIKKLGEQ